MTEQLLLTLEGQGSYQFIGKLNGHLSTVKKRPQMNKKILCLMDFKVLEKRLYHPGLRLNAVVTAVAPKVC